MDTAWEPPPEWTGPNVHEPLSENDEAMAQYIAKQGEWPIEKARWSVASIRIRREQEVSES